MSKTDIIRIKYFSFLDEQGQKMVAEDRHVADIWFRKKETKTSYITEIRVIDDYGIIENLAHELGHFLQKYAETLGMKFAHDEEWSFLLEDVVRSELRKKLYNLKEKP